MKLRNIITSLAVLAVGVPAMPQQKRSRSKKCLKAPKTTTLLPNKKN